MVVVLAVDALEYKKVEEFDSRGLKQTVYGKTDISEFSEPRTMVLWCSFMTGQNLEREILAQGDEEMWKTTMPLERTFFSRFQDPRVIDLPGFSYDQVQHDRQRELLKEFFEKKSREEKEKIRSEYNQHAFRHHKKLKEEFFGALKGDHDFLLGYFSVADVVGHLNFGNKALMRLIYDDLDDITTRIREDGADPLLVLSDHGMKGVGMFGDHNNYGFWSFSKKCPLKNPKITDFAGFLTKLK